MATSPNFNWPEPDNTDLVKNGALAIRTAVNAIDSSLAELKGGTTGQVLSKTSNTDMDFTWVAQDDSNAIQNTIVDAKGDLIAATGADTPARLAVGANTAVLVADSAQSTGLKWDGVWTNYTPTYLNLTPGNGTVTARFRQIGKSVQVFYRLVWGSTTSCGNYPIVSYPVTPAYTGVYAGICGLQDSGVGTYSGRAFLDGANGILFYATYTGGNSAIDQVVQATVPATWTTNDVFYFTVSYEAA